MKKTSLGIVGVGHHLPGAPVSNEAVAETASVDIEWIRERTGIESRHYAAPEALTSDLATQAARRAIEVAPIGADMIAVGTSTPDRLSPSTACYVQRNLGLSGGPALDVSAGCSGFLYALSVATAMVAAGLARRPLVVAVDVLTRFVDPTDRRVAPLFGDAAGAVQLGPVPDGYGILALELWADGTLSEIAGLPLHGGYFQMDGRGVKRVVMEMGPKILEAALAKAGVRLDQLNRVLVHQANPKLVRWLGDFVGLPPEVVPDYGRLTGNTAGASVPVAFSMAHAERPFRDGDLFALLAVGAGMTGGAAIVRWHDPAAAA
ncbi:ketoacyl-ACP synthase III [Streptomyces sp. WMMC500]|uniref:3-oxoacyl-ACP synthase III family protein n=1 Tax=Streptomyces sp. WMMC500 TaxID=3015154 RepID=UPI00248C791E|nr:ketoacyl-ACP synthase III [Streptomyces sp. WMMC500]WBB60975.1 ketoacyl-ACP synthase III [Streptomyces sp. WMMC500]